MTKRWTKQEERTLLQGIGVYGLSWFRAHCGDANNWPNVLGGRSIHAVYAKARRLYGQGGLTRGSYTVTQIVQSTGYSRTQVLRAMRALAQKWKRLSPNGAYLIHEDQYDDLTHWLGKDYWSKKHRLYNCLWCHQHSREHEAKGLCLQCYSRYVKTLERQQLPIDNKALLELVRERVSDNQKIVLQLTRGRALPEPVIQCLI